MCLIKKDCFIKQEKTKKEEFFYSKTEPPVFSADGS